MMNLQSQCYEAISNGSVKVHLSLFDQTTSVEVDFFSIILFVLERYSKQAN